MTGASEQARESALPGNEELGIYRLFGVRGKVALVTGARRGLGKAMALGLAKAGADIAAVAKSPEASALEAEVKALILRLKEAFPGCELICDAFSAMTAARVQAHPSLQQTGAAIKWGIDDARDIERWAEGIQLLEEWYFTQAEEIRKLGWTWRLSFQIAGLFTVAKRAHRILYYRL